MSDHDCTPNDAHWPAPEGIEDVRRRQVELGLAPDGVLGLTSRQVLLEERLGLGTFRPGAMMVLEEGMTFTPIDPPARSMKGIRVRLDPAPPVRIAARTAVISRDGFGGGQARPRGARP